MTDVQEGRRARWRILAFPKRSKALPDQIPRYADITEVTGTADKSLGILVFGESWVDCSFLNARSKWGLINDEPTGLLAIRVTIAEDSSYKIADVTLNLDFAVLNSSSSTTSSVRITDHIKPVSVYGQATESRITTECQLVPEVNVLSSVSIGGVGVKKTKEMPKTHRWTFSCRFKPDVTRNVTLAQFRFEGNPDMDQVDCLEPVYAGLAIVHDKTAFSVRLIIEGNLRRGKVPYMVRPKGGSDKSKPFDTKISPRHQANDIQSHIEPFKDEIKRVNMRLGSSTSER